MERLIKAAELGIGRIPSILALLSLAVGFAASANAAVIKFDEFAADDANGAIDPNRYVNWGVTFDGTDDGSTWGGTSAGDPGGWGVEGTDGTVISAYNGNSYANRMVFDAPVRSFALDISRTNGSAAGDSFILEGWKNGVMVENRSVSFDDIDTWKTAVLFSEVDEVRWSGVGGGFHPYAVDNVRWTNDRTKRIIFDEYPAQNSNGSTAGDYSALGVTISNTDDGSTWDGVSRGDPGGWGVDGTNGSVFASHNGTSYATTLSFDSDVKYVAVELSRTNGSSADDTVTLEGWKNGALIETQLIPLDEIDRWKMAVLRSTVDEVRVVGNGVGFHPFALDNVSWTSPDAAVIRFDEFAADNANGGLPSNRYSEWGVTIQTSDDGSTWDGRSRGDPGGWNLEGTNGSVFAAFNGDAYGLEMEFDGIIASLSLDAARGSGSSDGDSLTLEGYLNGVLIDSMTASLTAINTWTPFELMGQIDSLRLFGTGSGFHPFGIDNVTWLWIQRNDTAVPEPATSAVFGLGLAGFGLAARRRKRQRSHA